MRQPFHEPTGFLRLGLSAANPPDALHQLLRRDSAEHPFQTTSSGLNNEAWVLMKWSKLRKVYTTFFGDRSFHGSASLCSGPFANWVWLFFSSIRNRASPRQFFPAHPDGAEKH